MTSRQSTAFGRSMLARMNVDWEASGYGADELRVLQSLVLARGHRQPPTEFELL